jgi:hypothetical protein
MSSFEESFHKALAEANREKDLSKGTRHSITTQAEGDARTAFEGAAHVHPLPRGTSVAALKRHAGVQWHRYHRDAILPTPEMMFDCATSAARLYIKTFVAAFQAEVRRVPPTAKGKPDAIYASTYCNFGHRMSTGHPVGHECRIIPPAALRAEREGNTEEAIRIMQATPARTMRGRR